MPLLYPRTDGTGAVYLLLFITLAFWLSVMSFPGRRLTASSYAPLAASDECAKLGCFRIRAADAHSSLGAEAI